MTPDERALLTNFLQDLTAARGIAKDGEADQLIRQALAANPDAAYVLVQHAIVADQSLHAAQGRIAELEQQVRTAQSAPAASSFLPGAGQGGPWGQRGAAPSPSPIPQDYEPMPPQQRPGLFSANSGLGSFLRNAGTTAAGVAGGEMLFSGLSDLFGHRGGGGGMFGGGGQPEEVVVNNFYDDDGQDNGQGNNDDFSGDDQGNW